MADEKTIDDELAKVELEEEGKEFNVSDLNVLKDTIVDEDDTAVDEPKDSADTDVSDTEAPKSASSDDVIEKLKELENANKGLINNLKAERTDRKALQAQMDEITSIFREAKDMKEEAGDSTDTSSTVSAEDEAKVSKIKVQWDDNGDPYVDASTLTSQQKKDLIDPGTVNALMERINSLENTLSNQDLEKSERKYLTNILSADKAYPAAYKTLEEAWQRLAPAFDEYLTTEGLNKPINNEQAIEMVLAAKPMQDLIAKEFPTVDLENLMEAKLIGTTRYLKKALKQMSSSSVSDTSEALPDIPNIDNTTSGKVGTTGLLERVANMSTEDYLKLTPEAHKKIDKLLAQQG